MEFFKKKASELIPDSLKDEVQELALSVTQAAIKKILESPEVREIKRKLVREMAQKMLEQELEKIIGEKYPLLQKSARTVLLPIVSHSLDKAIDQALNELRTRTR
ncbi:MAG: hypothetical protein ACFFBD_12645 [Candidatus Hodarchaeota archaeon]